MLNSSTLSFAADERLAPLEPHADQVLIAVNPRAGAASSTAAIAGLADELRKQHLRAEVITDLATLADGARSLLAAGRLRAVVAAGGDGTLAELVNRTTPDTPLAVYPRGTANLLAGYLGLRANPADFAAMLAGGRAVRFDAGLATWLGSPARSSGAGQGSLAGDGQPPPPATSPQQQAASASRIFLIMAGVGFDADVVQRMHQNRTGHIRWWGYAKPILESIRTYAYPELRCECAATAPQPAGPGMAPTVESSAPKQVAQTTPDVEATDDAGVEAVSARWVFVHNLPCYAGRLNIAPQAAANDGLLDVSAFERGSLWNGLRYVTEVWRGTHQRSSDVRSLRTGRLVIAADVPVPVQLDGDPGGCTPVAIEVLPARVRLIVPPNRLKT